MYNPHSTVGKIGSIQDIVSKKGEIGDETLHPTNTQSSPYTLQQGHCRNFQSGGYLPESRAYQRGVRKVEFTFLFFHFRHSIEIISIR